MDTRPSYPRGFIAFQGDQETFGVTGSSRSLLNAVVRLHVGQIISG